MGTFCTPSSRAYKILLRPAGDKLIRGAYYQSCRTIKKYIVGIYNFDLKNEIKFCIIIVEENEFKISFEKSKNELKNEMKIHLKK